MVGENEYEEPPVSQCTEDEPCEEIVVVGEQPNTPNSAPTPSTGSNAPANSSSESCEGSGCIDYESSYSQFRCESLLEGYEEATLFQQIHMGRSYQECVQGEMTLKAICGLLDLEEIANKAGTAAGCAAACAASKKLKHPGFIGGCVALCAAYIEGAIPCPE